VAFIYGHPDSAKRFLDKLPDEVETIRDIPRVQQKMQNDFDSIEDNGLRNKFNRWRKKRQINKIEENRGSPLHKGAKGGFAFLLFVDKFAWT